ncbi:HAMP domain-containing histidine kinase [Alkalicella caledoniensis]|uniref:histidine kinase n=1 Tax=Alkalicella caledoniensis TaxID=2731377 RepID=A0A7G9W766_ALKCA|nr:HAMP domain-containing sensor histidine kinase [Alkalicella caledoniensis]QNO14528.1 HAMP domain-containing histidine kinase [Alkalicella caledoniensis]
MVTLKFKHRVILAFFSVIFIPLIITTSFLFFYGRYLYREDSSSFTLNYETTSAIDSYITGNWNSILLDYWGFDNGLKKIIDDKPIGLRIIDTEGELIYDSSSTTLPDKIDMYKNIVPGLQSNGEDPNADFLTYTRGEYVTINGQDVGIILYTYPPPPEFLSKLLRLILSTFAVGMITLLTHITFSVYLISRRVTKPMKELYMSIDKISKNDFDFDITYSANDELGTLCQGFQTMKNKLKDYHNRELVANETKKQLVASISHDLRTPMTSIKGYVEALQDGLASDPKKFNHYLSIISSKVESLNRLIDDLFELSKIDVGQLKMTKEKVDVKSFIYGFYMDIKEEAGWQDIIISKEFINIDTCIIDVDTTRLVQALNNVVYNAFKFCNKEIVLSCYAQGDSIHFSVVDDGLGVPNSEIPFIFDKFYKVEKARTTKSGSGLGLAIAKGIITQMGGTIEVYNNENTTGATFTIKLPRYL